MKSICKKLKSESGATILMAFLMLLVAVTVSAVIISASVTASKNAVNDIESQQNMLDASAAAELIKKQLDGACYTYSRTTYFSDLNHTVTISIGDPVITVTDCDFPELIEDAVEKASLGFTYSTPLTISEPNMGDIKATFSMENSSYNDYKIKVELYSADQSENSAYMIVTAYGTYQESKQANGYNETTEKTITWGNPEIRKGAAQ